jgi:cyanophycinase
MLARFGFRHSSILVGIAASLPVAASDAAAQQPTHWWPEQGAVILAGGGIEPPTFDAIAARLIALAGGPDAPIVIIPTANEAVAPRLRGTGPPFDPTELKTLLEAKGAHHVTVLHTRDRRVADSDAFVKPLREARGVWIPGGGGRILERTYRGTRVAQELAAVLTRGGVLLGDSAGAIAIGCFMLGWKPDPWGIVVDGLAVLPHATIVPHANRAQGYVPADETLGYLVRHPGPTGVIIDENTALVLHGPSADVVGVGNVALVDPAKNAKQPFLSLRAGSVTDLSK